MNEISNIKDLAKRIERIEETLAEVAGGDLNARIDIDLDAPDELVSVESGINLLISDLRDEVLQRQMLAEELAEIKKKQNS